MSPKNAITQDTQYLEQKNEITQDNLFLVMTLRLYTSPASMSFIQKKCVVALSINQSCINVVRRNALLSDSQGTRARHGS